MKLSDLIAETRRRLDDQAAPYLWSDEELTAYLNAAEREACERAKLIEDDSSAMTLLNLVAGTAKYNLNPLILGVNRVFMRGRALDRTTREKLDDTSGRWEDDTGEPRAFMDEVRYLRLYPQPTEDDTARLTVWRLPLLPMEDEDDEPEIGERYHLRMLDWAIRLAYLKRDADAFDQAKADKHEAMFINSFGIRPDSNVQRKQRLKKVPVCRPHW